MCCTALPIHTARWRNTYPYSSFITIRSGRSGSVVSNYIIYKDNKAALTFDPDLLARKMGQDPLHVGVKATWLNKGLSRKSPFIEMGRELTEALGHPSPRNFENDKQEMVWLVERVREAL